MTWILEQGDKYGWAFVIIAAIAWAIWRTREQWMPWIGINVEARQRQLEQEAELAHQFQDQMQQKLLLNGKEKDEIIKWVQRLYEDAISELRTTRRAMYDGQIGAQQTSKQFADVMVRSFEVLDGLAQRLDAQTEATRENTKVLAQAWFVFARERKVKGDDVDVIVEDGS